MAVAMCKLAAVAVVGLLIACHSVRARDATFLAASGAPYCDVVEAVLTKISQSNVFPSDNGFLRRIAYAESAGSVNASRAGSFGLWGATRAFLSATQTTDNTTSDYMALRILIEAVANSTQLRNEFGQALEWRTVTEEQLALPFYSALTVRLYLHLVVSRDAALSELPVRLDQQATVWRKTFIPDSGTAPSVAEEATVSQSFVNRTRQFDDKCACNADVDIAFVMDMSGSVTRLGFTKAKEFAALIAGSFDVNQNATRIALVTYSTTIVVNFNFDSYSSASDVMAAIRSAPYEGKGTKTGEAIQKVIDKVFMLDKVTTPPPTTTMPTTTPVATTAAATTQAVPTPDRGLLPDGFGGGGGNPGIEPQVPTEAPTTVLPTIAPISVQPRIAVVITDGKSNDDVKPASDLAHELGLTVFAIGVGSIDVSELRTIASDPDEAHVYTVGDFDVIENIRTSIRDRSCRTPATIAPMQPIGGTLKENETQFVAVPLPPDEPPVVTVTVTAQQGDIGFFASFQYPNPSEALNDFSGVVKEGDTSYFVISNEEQNINTQSGGRRRRQAPSSGQATQLYMSVVGKSPLSQFVLQAQSGNVAPTTAAPKATRAAVSAGNIVYSSSLCMVAAAMLSAACLLS